MASKSKKQEPVDNGQKFTAVVPSEEREIFSIDTPLQEYQMFRMPQAELKQRVLFWQRRAKENGSQAWTYRVAMAEMGKGFMAALESSVKVTNTLAAERNSLGEIRGEALGLCKALNLFRDMFCYISLPDPVQDASNKGVPSASVC